MGSGASIEIQPDASPEIQERLKECQESYTAMIARGDTEAAVLDSLSARFGDILPYITTKDFPLAEQMLNRKKSMSDGDGPLILACKMRNLTSVKTILAQEGVKIDSKDRDEGKTPLIIACKAGDLAIATALMEKGADCKIKDRLGFSSLHYACKEGHDSICEYLLQQGAPLEQEAKDGNGCTPLLFALEAGYGNLALFLIDKGANMKVSDQEDSKMNLLHFAIRRGLLSVGNKHSFATNFLPTSRHLQFTL